MEKPDLTIQKESAWQSIPDYADLHVHSFFSDGALHPSRIVQKAAEAGLKIISITDHDCVDGIEPALKEGEKTGIEVIPGVELTAMSDEREIHILGYFIDPHHPELAAMIRLCRQHRLIRYQKILGHLKSAGVSIRTEQLEQLSLLPNIGRLHIAEALVSSGVTANIQTAFRYFLGKGAIAYEKKCPVTPEVVIGLIRRSGGLSVLAHPSLHLKEKELISMIRSGLDGIETVHPKLDASTQSYYQRIALQYGLIQTGGSDSHGRKGFAEIGDYRISGHHISVMKDRLVGRFAACSDNSIIKAI